MFAALSEFELHLPEARSLKAKRKIVRSLIDRLHHRYRLSIAETGLHDLHQRARIGLAAVHGEVGQLEEMIDEIERIVAAQPGALLLHWEPEILEPQESGIG